MVTLGGFLGPFLYGFIAKKYGKRVTILLVGLPQLISSLIIAFAQLIELLYVARFLTGLAMGGTFTTVTNYLIELTNKNNRGVIGSLGSLTASFGMLSTYCLGPYLDIMVFNCLLAAIACTFEVAFFLIAVECPVYHLSRGNEEKAKNVIEMKQGKITNKFFFNLIPRAIYRST